MPRYLISRTSHYGTPDDEDEDRRDPPCEGAFPITRQSWDRRTFRSEAEHDERFGDIPWRSKGSEHQTYSGGIMRRWKDRRVWAIEAESIDALVGKFGRLVVSQDWHGPNEEPMLDVEIYDGYRE